MGKKAENKTVQEKMPLEEKNSSSDAKAISNSAYVSNFLHIISVFVTALCSIFMIFLVNSRLIYVLGSGNLLWQGLKSFLNRPAVSSFVFSKTLAVCCIVFIVILFAANGVIYRNVDKKIFEHYAVVFIAAGGVSLLFMLAFEDKRLYLAACGVLLLAGGILFLIYAIRYHALNRKMAQANTTDSDTDNKNGR